MWFRSIFFVPPGGGQQKDKDQSQLETTSRQEFRKDAREGGGPPQEQLRGPTKGKQLISSQNTVNQNKPRLVMGEDEEGKGYLLVTPEFMENPSTASLQVKTGKVKISVNGQDLKSNDFLCDDSQKRGYYYVITAMENRPHHYQTSSGEVLGSCSRRNRPANLYKVRFWGGQHYNNFSSVSVGSCIIQGNDSQLDKYKLTCYQYNSPGILGNQQTEFEVWSADN